MSERPVDELRAIELEIPFTDSTPGSVLISMGRTKVLCAASLSPEVPRWMRDTGKGWITAEYAMLPGSSPERVRRDHVSGGRAKEISRLIGRSLRAAVDLNAMPDVMAMVDCDVLEADGGTRTAAITGAWIALHYAFQDGLANGRLARNPIIDEVAAVSVGIVDGVPTLDLEYVQDVAAEVDMNVVMSGRGLLVEVQGTAERAPFSRDDLDRLLDLAAAGIAELHELQRRAIAE